MRSPARLGGGPVLAVETQRLLLRPVARADAAAAAQMMNAQLAGQLVGWSSPMTAADVAERIRRGERQRSAGTALDLAVLGRVDQALRGWVEFRLGGRGDLELAFWIGSEHQGRGFAAEALRAAIPPAIRLFEPRTLSAIVFADNEVAIRILRRLGLHPQRTARRGADRFATLRFHKELCGIL